MLASTASSPPLSALSALSTFMSSSRASLRSLWLSRSLSVACFMSSSFWPSSALLACWKSAFAWALAVIDAFSFALNWVRSTLDVSTPFALSCASALSRRVATLVATIKTLPSLFAMIPWMSERTLLRAFWTALRKSFVAAWMSFLVLFSLSASIFAFALAIAVSCASMSAVNVSLLVRFDSAMRAFALVSSVVTSVAASARVFFAVSFAPLRFCSQSSSFLPLQSLRDCATALSSSTWLFMEPRVSLFIVRKSFATALTSFPCSRTSCVRSLPFPRPAAFAPACAEVLVSPVLTLAFAFADTLTESSSASANGARPMTSRANNAMAFLMG